MRLNLKTAKEIVFDIYYSNLDKETIMSKYNINKKQFYNLKNGTTFPEIIRPGTNGLPESDIKDEKVRVSDTEKRFISTLRKVGYGVKQIHIIIGKYSYNTVSKISKEDFGMYEFGELPDLDLRLKTFEFLTTPYEEMVNQIENRLTINDLVYIVFLARMRVPFEKALRAFMTHIKFETSFWENPITNEEELLKYLGWHSSRSIVISILGNTYKNKIRTYGEDKTPFFFDDVSLNELSRCCPDLDLSIAHDMIMFKTNDGYERRKDIERE